MATTTTTINSPQAPSAYLGKSSVLDMNGVYGNPNGNNVTSQIFLTPIAAPGIMGFFAYAVPAVVLGVRWAHWYGTAASAVYLWPILLAFGIMQLLCSMFSYLARDNLATAFHGIWGSLWLALGVYYLSVTRGFIILFIDGTQFAELAVWFAVVGSITFGLLLGSFAQGLGTVITTLFATVSAFLACIAIFHGHIHILKAAGWLFFFSGLFAWYTASAWLIEYQFMRPILPFNNFNLYNRFAFFNRGVLYDPVVVNRGFGEPGVMKGQ